MHGQAFFEEGAGDDGRSTPRSRPFYPKRPHTKSRRGCVNCKTRKVKCDEGLPSCRLCHLRRDPCVYAKAVPATRTKPPRQLIFIHCGPRSSETSPDTTPAASTSEEDRSLSRGVSANPILASSSLGMLPLTDRLKTDDMRLLWNYTVKTVGSIVFNEDHQRLAAVMFREGVVVLAFDAPFLMDSILAVSCLELHKRDSRFPLHLAHSHHLQAVKSYNIAISEARPEMFPAIAVNAFFLGFLTSHTFRDPNASDLYIVDWLTVWRGLVSIIDFIGIETVMRAGFGVIMYRAPIDPETSARAVPDNLNALIATISDDDEDFPSITAYTTTVTILGSLYMHLWRGLGSDLDHRIACWLTKVPRAFAMLAQQFRPRTLIILAHLACFYKLMTLKLWWMEGVGERIISDVLKHLSGTPWMAWLDVPIAVQNLTDSVSIARVLLGKPDWTSPKRSKDQMNSHFRYVLEENPVTASAELLRIEHGRDVLTDVRVEAAISQRLSQVTIA